MDGYWRRGLMGKSGMPLNGRVFSISPQTLLAIREGVCLMDIPILMVHLAHLCLLIVS